MDASIGKKRKTKKQSPPQLDEEHASGPVKEANDQYDLNEPTMGEKLAEASLVVDSKLDEHEDSPAEMKPPSADSVHLLLKQALRAEDHALLLNCLYTKDDQVWQYFLNLIQFWDDDDDADDSGYFFSPQVIRNSVSSLNPSDALKLLDSLISMVPSRGAVLVCCIPWLRTVLVHHASSIISHSSSRSTLNTLYQMIESRVSTFGSALRLAACLDDVFAGIPDLDEGDEEEEVQQPVIFEDWDSEEEGSIGSGNEEDEDDLGDVIDLPRGSHGRDDDDTYDGANM